MNSSAGFNQSLQQWILTGLDIIDVFDIPFNSADGRSYIESLDRDSKGTDSWHVLGTTVYHCRAYDYENQQVSVALRLTLMNNSIRSLVYISQSHDRRLRSISATAGQQGNQKLGDSHFREEGMRYIQADRAQLNAQQHGQNHTKILNINSLEVLRQLLTDANNIGKPSLQIPANLADYRVGRDTAWYNAMFYCPNLKLPRLHEAGGSSSRRCPVKLISNLEDCEYTIYPLGAMEYATLYPDDHGIRVCIYHLTSLTDAYRRVANIVDTLNN